MSRDRPTSIGIGIIKFNARTNSVCSSPSACAASSSVRRMDTLSVGDELSGVEQQQQLLQQRFIELCANDDDNDADAAANSAPVSEADECGSVADESENLIQTSGVIISPCDVPVEEVIKSVKLADKTFPSDIGKMLRKTDEQNNAQLTTPGRLHKFWHKFLGIFRHYRTLPFRRLRLLSVAFLLIAFFSLPSFLAGLLMGVYLSLFAFLFCCVSDPLDAADHRWRADGQLLATVEQIGPLGGELEQNASGGGDDDHGKRRRPSSNTGRIYKGWMNILSEHYHPHTFHVNSIRTVLVRLDGHILRISRPERTMLKHCFHIDPTLTEPEPRMVSQKIYDLTDAQVVLRPRRLARRRWFSRKYPICIKLTPSNSDKANNNNNNKNSAEGLKRCHSLRQRTTAERHSISNNNNGTDTGTVANKSCAIDNDGGRECGEGAESDAADSAGDSVQSESTDDELNFGPPPRDEQRHHLLTMGTTAPQPPPPLSASCPTPADAIPSQRPTTDATACDRCNCCGCRCSPPSTAAVHCRRSRRRRTVPPRVGGEANERTGDALPIRQRCLASSSAYIFLFARSAREKERWFHQLRQATLRQQNAAEYFPAHFSTKIAHRCTSVPSLERLAAKLSDARVAYTLQNAQFAKHLASMIAGLRCCAAAAVSSSVDATAADGCAGVFRMDLGWTTNRNNRRGTHTTATTTNNNNGITNGQHGQKPKSEGEGAETAQQHHQQLNSDRSSDTNEFILLVNLIASRVFYDFCRDNYWCGAVRNKIQTKLATIHLPYFIDTLELSKLDLGTTTPQIVRVHPPTVDEWGIWCDFDIKYDGLIRLVLETRVNLMKLKSVSESSSATTTPSTTASSCPIVTAGDDDCGGAAEQRYQQQQRHSCSGCCATAGGTTAQTMTTTTTPLFPLLSTSSTYRINRYTDEEIPESPETSPDEEFGSKLKPDDWLDSNNGTATTARRMKTGQKLISWVDRIAHTKYFREASELKLIRKMMEEISSMRLLLNVQVTTLEGRMCCNFPPPPSDRLWYAFRAPPRMSVKAVPQVGDRSVELSLVSEWIENKLQLILEKNLVLPNMDDVIIPVCSGNKLLQGGLDK